MRHAWSSKQAPRGEVGSPSRTSAPLADARPPCPRYYLFSYGGLPGLTSGCEKDEGEGPENSGSLVLSLSPPWVADCALRRLRGGNVMETSRCSDGGRLQTNRAQWASPLLNPLLNVYRTGLALSGYIYVVLVFFLGIVTITRQVLTPSW